MFPFLQLLASRATISTVSKVLGFIAVEALSYWWIKRKSRKLRRRHAFAQV